MPADTAPKKITLRSYQVGFGDCFLLILRYADNSEKFVLFDFGSTGIPDKFPPDQMMRIAKNIKKRCNGKLDAIIATHRHKDHISGFATDGPKDPELKMSTGELIASCKPTLVIQPWTENPALTDSSREASPLADSEYLKKNEPTNNFLEKRFSSMLRNMHNVAEIVCSEGERLGTKLGNNGSAENGFVRPIDESKKNLLKTMGGNNIRNLSAVTNLRTMGRQIYVNYGTDLDALEKLLGVKAHVLGPPTVRQYNKVLKQRSRDDNEFWMITASLQNYWKIQSATANLTEEQLDHRNTTPDNPFPNAKVYNRFAPSHTRWLIHRMRNMRAEQLLSIVTILDKAMNNTSVILLLTVGNKKLLFPGDAQIENWEYVLKHKREKPDDELKRLKLLEMLKDTWMYKVGHHGSRNATPKTLWNSFIRKTDDKAPEAIKKAMHTINSTMAGKHGGTEATAVPRKTLVEELSAHSHYHTTQTINPDFTDNPATPADERGLYFEIDI